MTVLINLTNSTENYSAIEESNNTESASQLFTILPPPTRRASVSEVFTIFPLPTTRVSAVPFLPWNNPHNVITYSTFRDIEFVFNCVLDPLLWLLGVSTNVINCVVFYRQGLKDRMNLCLFSLAMVDTLYLSSNLLVDSHRFISSIHPGLANKLKAYLLAYCPGPSIALMLTSGALTMIVAIERCICVVFPMKASTLISTRAMGMVIIFVLLLLQVAGLSILTIKFKITSRTDKVTGITTYTTIPTNYYLQNQLVFKIFEFIFVSPILPVTTFLVVSLTTTVTVIRLRLALAWRASTSSAGSKGEDGKEGSNRISQQQAALTKVLVLVSCLYITCSVPSVAMAITRFAVDDEGFKPWGRFANIFFAAHDVSYTVAAINSSCNFFIYLWQSSRFRQTLSSCMSCAKAWQISEKTV